MPYRESSKPINDELDPLFYVIVSYQKPKESPGSVLIKTAWVREKDSFKALTKVIKQCDTVPEHVWYQDVITVEDFYRREKKDKEEAEDEKKTA